MIYIRYATLGDSKTVEVGCEIGNDICTIKTQSQASTNKFCILAAGHCTLLADVKSCYTWR